MLLLRVKIDLSVHSNINKFISIHSHTQPLAQYEFILSECLSINCSENKQSRGLPQRFVTLIRSTSEHCFKMKLKNLFRGDLELLESFVIYLFHTNENFFVDSIRACLYEAGWHWASSPSGERFYWPMVTDLWSLTRQVANIYLFTSTAGIFGVFV